MFQLRRRTDLIEIEASLAALGGHKLVWDGDEIAREIGQGEFAVRGLPFYRFEGFQWLRGLMYVIVLALSSLFLLTLIGVFGLGPFAA